ncbi:uncharacterized protein FPOAC1_012848 [Fusarium poae]|uniref:uncharacterized protein n=1 Tax=Fusarium poae TaxID=36050 RepID=UPI001D052AAC|nr:uncharacterized protein FPOAC1_012848 [Fusarium poae]KAG8664871.1 hypothetical protein FPOAC1_012848 [Fusarium poae]
MDQNQTRASGFIDTLWEEDDYLEDIIDHLAYMEDVTLPSILMIEKQEQITWDLRSNLIDFVTRSHQHFRLPSHVLFLSINLIDRYCSRRQVFREHYWLLGSVALFIASKYGDRTDRGKNLRPLSVSEIRKLCHDIFDAHMIAQMEVSILYTLDWVMGHPTTDHYLDFLLVGEPRGGELASMAAYLSEISLYHPEFVGIKPSVIATSCCMLAKSILFGTVSIGTNTEIVVMETLNSLWKRLRQPPPAISDKYSTQSRHYVAQTVFYRLAG